jgi:U3 small nucleolar RNA-associated protein 21
MFSPLIEDGHPVLASASSAGHIALWDLNSGGRLLHIVRGAHDGAVTAIEWVPGQPLLISSGEDNSVKVRNTLPYFNCL